MTKQVIYRYLGTNGIIESPVHLEDVYYTRMFLLRAGKNKILTNGTRSVLSVKVPEDEVDNWIEKDAG